MSAREKTMTDHPAAGDWLRQGFKWLNRYMVIHWRLGLGPIANRADLSGCIMVLVHTGRKSGLVRRTPVNYALIEGDVYCAAGFGSSADWYRNVLATPAVELWLPSGWFAGSAADVTDLPPAEKAAILRQVLINSGFAARMAGIDAARMSDAALLTATAGYRLVRIRCTEARTGAGGPGDLAWVWPLATLILGALVLLRRRR
jgi:deazaflavin-dependent oxidoreductase (nitroreductase family)